MPYYLSNDNRCKQLRCAVPAGFQKSNGIDKHEFFVWDIHHAFRSEELAVRFHPPAEPGVVFVHKSSNRVLFEAVLLTDSLRSQHPHAERFMRIYKSLESLSSGLQLEFRAIRHSLAHSASALTNRPVVDTLNLLFGTVNIDLTDYVHRKEFYRHFSAMLIENDRILYSKLKRRVHV